MLIEALGLSYEAPSKGHWKCLILRRTFPQLTELITRATELYPQIVNGIKFNSQKNIFKMPSGSFIQFASCERDEDVEQYRGREFNLICIDEGSHFESPFVFNFLKSCNRNAHGYPNRMIITTNPCNWIKKMCNVDDYGHDTFQRIEYYDEKLKKKIIKTMRFIQMNLETNPHLSEDYRAALYSDELNRDRFLFGLWKNPEVPGQVLKDELSKFDEDEKNRLIPIIKDNVLPVHVFTDLGYSDNTCLLFCQFIGDRINILNFYENNQTAVDEYINVITQLYGDQAIVHLPHDAQKHETNGKTVRNYWEARVKVSYDSGANGNLPRLSNEEYLNRVKINFNRLYFNDVPSNRILLDHLKNYRRKWAENLGIYLDPIHDIHSHAFDTLKYIFTYEAPKAIPRETMLSLMGFGGNFGQIF